MSAASPRPGNQVNARKKEERIANDSVRTHRYDLAKLLKEITPKNLHTEVGFGEAIGKEAF